MNLLVLLERLRQYRELIVKTAPDNLDQVGDLLITAGHRTKEVADFLRTFGPTVLQATSSSDDCCKDLEKLKAQCEEDLANCTKADAATIGGPVQAILLRLLIAWVQSMLEKAKP